jgi:hypothetical protein
MNDSDKNMNIWQKIEYIYFKNIEGKEILGFGEHVHMNLV